MAKERDHSAGRRHAKCTYCNNVLDGKPHFLKKHIINECQSIPGDKKSEYINIVTPHESDESEIESTPKAKIAPLRPKFVHNYTQSTFNHFVERKQDKMDEIHKDLCLALIIGRVPFSLLENEYFVRFQKQLSICPITPISRYVMMNRILPTVHAKCVRDMRKDLASQSGLTISLDGWSDICHNIRHTSDNILSSLNATLELTEIKWDQIAAIRIIKEAHPHVFGILCSLHFFNLIAKDFIEHKDMKVVVDNNKDIVRHFTVSHHWTEHLESWRKKEGVTHNIQSSCDSRWYTFTKVCISVDAHENGFLKCVEMAENPLLDTPSIPKKISQLVQTRDHFTANKALVLFLQPVVDSLGRLELATTTVGDIWKEICTLYTIIKDINLSTWPGYAAYKAFCLNILNTRSRQYNEPIFIVGFFLTPSCRQVAVSGTYPINTVQKMIVKIAYFWGYSEADSILIAKQAGLYLKGEGHFGTSKKFSFALDYWRDVPLTLQTQLLKQFAIKLLEIIAHAAGIESLYSAMSATKTKARASITLTNLKMISQVQLAEQNKTRLSQNSQSSSENQLEVIEIGKAKNQTIDGFSGPDKLEEFEEGLARCSEDHSAIDPHLEDDEFSNDFINSMFDLKLFQPSHFHQVMSNGASAPAVGAPGAWNPDSISFD
ncbi:hypothetical protein DFH28DRAFT_1117164 [Melampsora americana]|nr:hypothetical protein DFH28DRAFT_1117164 [Melampsora americana]